MDEDGNLTIVYSQPVFTIHVAELRKLVECRLAINSTINSIPSILWKLKSRASIQSIPFDTPIDCFNST
jgi:hypothetical protein